jgi:hypothetical protein
MRLAHPPDQATLTRLYHELGRLGARTVAHRAEWEYGAPTAEEVVVLAAQAARYDPRLLWVLVEFLTNNFGKLDPVKLRAALRASAWPGALGVAFEFARRASRSPELEDLHHFTMRGIPRASGEQFFLSTHAFGGELSRREAEESLAEYKRWGFVSREEPLPKELGPVSRGTLGRPERLNLLLRLVRRLGSISLSDYLEALGHRASARQASRDLSTAPFLVRRGTTRGARYVLKETARPDRPLRIGERVQVRVSGRLLNGVVVEDRGTIGVRKPHQLVRLRVHDPVRPAERYEVEVPADWATVRP